MLKALAKKGLFGLMGVAGWLKPRLAFHQAPKHVYVIGDLYSESGLGHVTRALVKTLDGLVDYSVINLPMSVMSKQGTYDFGGREVRQLGRGISIFVGNPSILLSACLTLNPRTLLGNYTIGVWFWELAHIPQDWVRAGRLVNEVWAQSEFVARAFNGTGPQVAVMPFVVDADPVKVYDRRHFDLPDAPFVFLMTFDYLSHVARKNPMAVLRAFMMEFEHDPNVLLVIKSVNQDRCPEAAAEVQSMIGDCANVVVMDRYLNKDELLSLIRVANCYVSLHRSEGLGLGMAEAMAQGTLVVATGYSGNMDFMSADNALLVDYTLIPVDAGEYPYAADNFWAEPSAASARAQMRAAFDADERARHLTDHALLGMAQYTTAHQQRWVAGRLEQVR